MCQSAIDTSRRGYKEIGEFYTEDLPGLFKRPKPPAAVPPPKTPTRTAEQVYGAKSDSDEPQLLGTSALQIPLKTVQ